MSAFVVQMRSNPVTYPLGTRERECFEEIYEEGGIIEGLGRAVNLS